MIFAAGSSTDWTTISTAGIAAASGALGAFLGYIGARTQANAELRRQRELDEVATRTERRNYYAPFLHEERRIHELLRVGPTEDKSVIEGWLESLHEPLNGVILIGNSAVASAAVRLETVLREVAQQTVKWNNNAVTIGEWDAVYDRWRPAREALVDAMREDVSPGGAAISWPKVTPLATEASPWADMKRDEAVAKAEAYLENKERKKASQPPGDNADSEPAE